MVAELLTIFQQLFPRSLGTRILVALSCLALFYTFWKRVDDRRRSDVRFLPEPPRAKAHWFWGHELLVWLDDACIAYSKWLEDCARDLQKRAGIDEEESKQQIMRIKGAMFHDDIIVAADRAAIHHIFVDTDTYVKSPAFRPPISALLGKGVVWAEGAEHAFQRRLLAPAFSQEAVKGMSDDIFECAEKLESRLTNTVLTHGEGTGEVTINMVEYISACTLDIIGRVAFAHDFGASSTGVNPTISIGPNGELVEHSNVQVDTTNKRTDAQRIASSWSSLINLATTFPAFIAPLVFRALPFVTQLPIKALQTPGEVRVVVGSIAWNLVGRERENLDAEAEKDSKNSSRRSSRSREGRDILSILLRAGRGEQDAGRKLSDTQIIDNITTFALVGHETTAGTLDFALLELARNPEIQKKLREEVVRHGRDLSYEDVGRLEYLDAVIKESLRLYPASPQTERVALRDDVLPLQNPIIVPSSTPGGKPTRLTELKIKKGQVIHIPFKSIHTSERLWGPDAHEFRPERWLTPNGLPKASEMPYGWAGLVAFCDGPRNCIGWRLAVLESKIILATLVRSLEFKETTAQVRPKILQTLQGVVDGKGGVVPIRVSIAEDLDLDADN